MGVNSLPKTVTRQRRGCDLNPGPTAPESSTLTTWLNRSICRLACGLAEVQWPGPMAHVLGGARILPRNRAVLGHAHFASDSALLTIVRVY